MSLQHILVALVLFRLVTAGWVIAMEAGALVSGLNKTGPGEAAVVAAGPGIHRSLLSRLEALAPLR